MMDWFPLVRLDCTQIETGFSEAGQSLAAKLRKNHKIDPELFDHGIHGIHGKGQAHEKCPGWFLASLCSVIRGEFLRFCEPRQLTTEYTERGRPM
jgi:hypothetical protein